MKQILWGFIKKELSQALRDPKMRIILFVVPIVQIIAFGLALSSEVRNVRLAVIYKSDDIQMRAIERAALGSDWFIPASVERLGQDPADMIHSQAAEAVLVAEPGGLTAALGSDKPRLQLLIDATNSSRARTIEQYVNTIVARTINSASISAVSPSTFQIQTRILYNPSLITEYYMLPNTVSTTMCLVTIILCAMSIAREKEMGTFETLISSPRKPIQIVLGKLIPYILLAMMTASMAVATSTLIFHVPIRGPLWMLISAALVFVCASSSIGLLISSIAKTQQQAMMGGFLFLFPGIMLSGLLFPVENAPIWLRVFAYLNPLIYFNRLLENIFLKDGNLTIFLTNTGILALFALVLAPVAARRFKV